MIVLSKARLVAAVVVVLALLVTVYSQPPSASAPKRKFAALTIRVTDSVTTRPVIGAVVSPICMGGTPYGTNTYVTDNRGQVRATFYAGAWAAPVKVMMKGYETATLVLPPTNLVVSLKRIQK